MGLTPEEHALVHATIDHYNTVAAGRGLREFIEGEMYQEMANTMARMLAARGGFSGEPRVAMIVAEAISVGIWLAELGQTRMFTQRKVIQ